MNDNKEREHDRKADINREFGLRLFDRRLEIATGYLTYMDDRTREAVDLGQAVVAGKVHGLDTSGLRDLLSHRAVAGVLLLMPDSVIYNAQAALDSLTATAEAIERANELDDEEEREDTLEPAIRDLGERYRDVRQEMAATLRSQQSLLDLDDDATAGG